MATNELRWEPKDSMTSDFACSVGESMNRVGISDEICKQGSVDTEHNSLLLVDKVTSYDIVGISMWYLMLHDVRTSTL